MNRVHGSHGKIEADATGAGTSYTPIASLNAYTYDQKRDNVDVTAFQDTNKVYVVGLPDVKGTLGGWLDLDDPALWNIAMGNIACMLKLTPNTVATTPWVFTGKAWLDASLDVKATGAVSVTGNWVAAGAWAKTP